MEVNELQKWNIVNHIAIRDDNIFDISSLEALESTSVKIHKEKIPKKDKSPDYRIILIDFEGSPIFMCGILLQNIHLIFYIENYRYRTELYTVILNTLLKTKEYTYFAFSDHERFELLNIYRYLQVQGQNISQFSFIETFPVINLQKSQYESLAEAIYSINLHSAPTTGDPLLRNSKLVNNLFATQQFAEIIAHNKNCLLNEYSLLQKRWLKNYRI